MFRRTAINGLLSCLYPGLFLLSCTFRDTHLSGLVRSVYVSTRAIVLLPFLSSLSSLSLPHRPWTELPCFVLRLGSRQGESRSRWRGTSSPTRCDSGPVPLPVGIGTYWEILVSLHRSVRNKTSRRPVSVIDPSLTETGRRPHLLPHGMSNSLNGGTCGFQSGKGLRSRVKFKGG